jgi:hypothetical protein
MVGVAAVSGGPPDAARLPAFNSDPGIQLAALLDRKIKGPALGREFGGVKIWSITMEHEKS